MIWFCNGLSNNIYNYWKQSVSLIYYCPNIKMHLLEYLMCTNVHNGLQTVIEKMYTPYNSLNNICNRKMHCLFKLYRNEYWQLVFSYKISRNPKFRLALLLMGDNIGNKTLNWKIYLWPKQVTLQTKIESNGFLVNV